MRKVEHVEKVKKKSHVCTIHISKQSRYSHQTYRYIDIRVCSSCMYICTYIYLQFTSTVESRHQCIVLLSVFLLFFSFFALHELRETVFFDRRRRDICSKGSYFTHSWSDLISIATRWIMWRMRSAKLLHRKDACKVTRSRKSIRPRVHALALAREDHEMAFPCSRNFSWRISLMRIYDRSIYHEMKMSGNH